MAEQDAIQQASIYAPTCSSRGGLPSAPAHGLLPEQDLHCVLFLALLEHRLQAGRWSLLLSFRLVLQQLCALGPLLSLWPASSLAVLAHHALNSSIYPSAQQKQELINDNVMSNIRLGRHHALDTDIYQARLPCYVLLPELHDTCHDVMQHVHTSSLIMRHDSEGMLRSQTKLLNQCFRCLPKENQASFQRISLSRRARKNPVDLAVIRVRKMIMKSFQYSNCPPA